MWQKIKMWQKCGAMVENVAKSSPCLLPIPEIINSFFLKLDTLIFTDLLLLLLLQAFGRLQQVCRGRLRTPNGAQSDGDQAKNP
jgi:hypothetical protein